MGGADHVRYYVANETISLVDQMGSGHVSMVAKELDVTAAFENAATGMLLMRQTDSADN